jgi:hypothetical protein
VCSWIAPDELDRRLRLGVLRGAEGRRQRRDGGEAGEQDEQRSREHRLTSTRWTSDEVTDL